jgi:hypothetical protein
MAEITAAALAAHMDCGVKVIYEYNAKGWIEKLPNGLYDRRKSRHSILANLRSDRRGMAMSASGNSLADAKASLALEQAEGAAFKNAVLRAEYVLVSAVLKRLTSTFIVMNEKLVVLAGKLSDECAMRPREEIYAIIRNAVAEIIDEFRTPQHYVEPDVGDGAGDRADQQGGASVSPAARADVDRMG